MPQSRFSSRVTPAQIPGAARAPEGEWVRGPVGASQPAKEEPEGASTLKLRVNAYVGLLKPYVTVTLLGVTLAAMEIAQGGLPPLVGWAAVTHSVTLPAICLFAIIFVWTPPHFWALALLIKNDYARARIPMLPVVAGDKATKQQIVLYSLVLVAVTLGLFAMHTLGLLYLASALALGGGFIYLAIRVLRDDTRRWARALFWYSNCYLALLFALIVIDRVIA